MNVVGIVRSVPREPPGARGGVCAPVCRLGGAVHVSSLAGEHKPLNPLLPHPLPISLPQHPRHDDGPDPGGLRPRRRGALPGVPKCICSFSHGSSLASCALVISFIATACLLPADRHHAAHRSRHGAQLGCGALRCAAPCSPSPPSLLCPLACPCAVRVPALRCLPITLAASPATAHALPRSGHHLPGGGVLAG